MLLYVIAKQRGNHSTFAEMRVMLGMGLGQITDVFARFESRDLIVRATQCSRMRHKNSTCSRCIEQCPREAITCEKELHVDAAKCNGCGICATVCPTGALEAARPTNPELLARIEQRKETECLAFVCPKARGGQDDHVIQVTCLGRLDESILLGAASWNIKHLLLVDGPCHDCANTSGCRVAGQVVAQVNALLGAFRAPTGISFVSHLPPELLSGERAGVDGSAISRRAFLNLLTRESMATASVAVGNAFGESTNASETAAPQRRQSPVHVPVKRRLLLDAFQRIGQPTGEDFHAPPSGWAAFQAGPNCTGCQMCAYFCPTGALRKNESGLDFQVAYCTDCRLCQEVCFWKAVELRPHVDLNKVVADTIDQIAPREVAERLSSEGKVRRLIASIH